MPWTPADAPQHTRAASTPALKELWAKVANERLEAGADDATAIREANAVVRRKKAGGFRLIALGLTFYTLQGCVPPEPPCAWGIFVNSTLNCRHRM